MKQHLSTTLKHEFFVNHSQTHDARMARWREHCTSQHSEHMFVAAQKVTQADLCKQSHVEYKL